MRKGFTLVELIFVIVIIGILAAAAIPQFKNLKQSAEANNLVKTVVDGASSAVSAAVNYRDLEEDLTYRLDDLVAINGKGWTYTDGTGERGGYTFQATPTSADSGSITLNDNNVTYVITCANLPDDESKRKCDKALGGDGTSLAATTTAVLPY